jgi:hypothetical protein
MRAAIAVLGLVALAACTTTKLETKAQLPPPLLEQLPVRIGVHYSDEFARYVHRETRSNIDYEVNLGPAHVTNLDWLLKAMFRDVVRVEDPSRVGGMAPPLAFVLEPKFEEYSFLTPKDVAGEAFIVTIRYLLTLYDGHGARVDSFALTGYGREKARTLASKEPLAIATQRAMRDAGAKVAVELTDQESVRLLLRGAGSPLPVSPPAPPETLKPPPASPPSSTATPPAGTSPPAQLPPAGPLPPPGSPPEGQLPPSSTPPGSPPPAGTEPPDESPPEEAPAEEKPPEETPPEENPPAETSPEEDPSEEQDSGEIQPEQEPPPSATAV